LFNAQQGGVLAPSACVTLDKIALYLNECIPSLNSNIFMLEKITILIDEFYVVVGQNNFSF
jgi:hypothetical protein